MFKTSASRTSVSLIRSDAKSRSSKLRGAMRNQFASLSKLKPLSSNDATCFLLNLSLESPRSSDHELFHVALVDSIRHTAAGAAAAV